MNENARDGGIRLDGLHTRMLRMGIVLLGMKSLFALSRQSLLLHQNLRESWGWAILPVSFSTLVAIVLMTQAPRVARCIAPKATAQPCESSASALLAWLAWALCVAVAYFLITDIAQGYGGLTRLVGNTKYAHPYTPLFDLITDDRMLLLQVALWGGLLLIAGLLLALPRWLRRWMEIDA